MVAHAPKLIGIVGGSCAGKTWLAERLQEELGEDALRISLDDFYRDRGNLTMARRKSVNFDHPRAIDWERVENVLGQLASGGRTTVPRYDFSTHARRATEPMVQARSIVIIEGLWLFRRASIRKLFTRKIFIRSANEWSEEMRMQRDVRERGRTETEARDQWNRFTRPMFEKFVAPQIRWADEVLESPVKESEVERLANQMKNQLSIGI